jgi:hypothetical protein
VPFVAYIREQDGSEPQRREWAPDWRAWGPGLGAFAALVAAGMVHGVAGLVLVVLAFALAFRAIETALPYGSGLREHKQ